MQINEFLNSVCEQIKYKPIRNTISEELKNHIEDKKEELIENGQNEQEAEENAVEQMGDAKLIGKELNKVHKPQIGLETIDNINYIIRIWILSIIYNNTK